jgi:hypothetical protein
MRWLIIALLISVTGLLIAAAGMAFHILRQRTRMKHQLADADAAVVGAQEASDREPES